MMLENDAIQVSTFGYLQEAGICHVCESSLFSAWRKNDSDSGKLLFIATGTVMPRDLWQKEVTKGLRTLLTEPN